MKIRAIRWLGRVVFGVLFLMQSREGLAVQNTSTPPTPEDCGSKNPEVTSTAKSLGICEELAGSLPWSDGKRQQTREALIRGQIKAALKLEEIVDARIQMQKGDEEVEEDEAAFRWHKLHNIWAGSILQGIGTGMQLSTNLHVQHKGDVIGVVGNGVSIFFAACTAEIGNAEVQTHRDAEQEVLSKMIKLTGARSDRATCDPIDKYLEAIDPGVKDLFKEDQKTLKQDNERASKRHKVVIIPGCRLFKKSQELDPQLDKCINKHLAQLEENFRHKAQCLLALFDEVDKATPPKP
ncbi:MAG: hypothetical protein JO340_05660 [Acidobacteriaceae bacterium]|nr:hypothetical protein [Acidobacteriaceae bacterium]